MTDVQRIGSQPPLSSEPGGSRPGLFTGRFANVSRFISGCLVVGALVGASCGCGLTRRATLAAAGNSLAGLTESIRSHPDPELVRAGLPALLLTIDGLLVESPEDPGLLRAAVSAYVAYCQAFLAGQDDSQRAYKLYDRARGYSLRLLEQRQSFEGFAEKPLEECEAALRLATRDDVPDLHLSASAWLGWIISSNGTVAALAELPKALALMERVLELDERYGNGSSHLVFAVFFAVQPQGAGQDLERSRQHFTRAIELAGPGSLLPRVLYAEYYGKATLDETFFTKTLEDVLQFTPSEYPQERLLNELAQERAHSLLRSREDIF